MKKISRYWSSLFCLLILVIPGTGQVKQAGLVTEKDSGGRPLTGVAVRLVGAAPVTSGSDGRFTAYFPDAFPGDVVWVDEIHKAGYELVNEDEMRSPVLSEKTSWHIVLCKAGNLDEARRHYYRMGEDYYRQHYEEVVAQLIKAKSEIEIDEQKFKERLSEASKLLEEQLKKLTYYADRFARINKDELSEMEVKTVHLLEKGDIEGAISIYEQSGITQKVVEYTSQLDTIETNVSYLLPGIAQEFQLLLKLQDAGNLPRMDTLYRHLRQCNYILEDSVSRDYMLFLEKNHFYEQAVLVCLDMYKHTDLEDRQTELKVYLDRWLPLLKKNIREERARELRHIEQEHRKNKQLDKYRKVR